MSDTTTRYVIDHINAVDLLGPVVAGPWRDFPADIGWTSTLRYRLVPGGMQLAGLMQGPLPAGARARTGILPDGFRPAAVQVLPCVVTSGVLFGHGSFELWQDGQCWTWWSIGGEANSGIFVSGIVAMD
jgi:hypothetical protein